jgi:type IV secretory pathway TrbF-like protein
MSAETNTLATLNRIVSVPEEKITNPYLEVETGLRVHNRYLRMILAVQVAVILMLLAERWRVDQQIADIRPIVVRVDNEGKAVAAPYASLQYQIREPEVRYFLGQFVKAHYSRIRATIEDDFKRRIYFLEKSKGEMVAEETRRNKIVENFLSGSDDQVDIEIRQIAVEDLKNKPYKATIEFDKVYSSPTDPLAKEKKRERFTAVFRFTLLENLPNDFVLVNPLGLIITDFHDSQGF